jgi:hypothetical protein
MSKVTSRSNPAPLPAPSAEAARDVRAASGAPAPPAPETAAAPSATDSYRAAAAPVQQPGGRAAAERPGPAAPARGSGVWSSGGANRSSWFGQAVSNLASGARGAVAPRTAETRTGAPPPASTEARPVASLTNQQLQLVMESGHHTAAHQALMAQPPHEAAQTVRGLNSYALGRYVENLGSTQRSQLMSHLSEGGMIERVPAGDYRLYSERAPAGQPALPTSLRNAIFETNVEMVRSRQDQYLQESARYIRALENVSSPSDLRRLGPAPQAPSPGSRYPSADRPGTRGASARQEEFLDRLGSLAGRHQNVAVAHSECMSRLRGEPIAGSFYFGANLDVSVGRGGAEARVGGSVSSDGRHDVSAGGSVSGGGANNRIGAGSDGSAGLQMGDWGVQISQVTGPTGERVPQVQITGPGIPGLGVTGTVTGAQGEQVELGVGGELDLGALQISGGVRVGVHLAPAALLERAFGRLAMTNTDPGFHDIPREREAGIPWRELPPERQIDLAARRMWTEAEWNEGLPPRRQ